MIDFKKEIYITIDIDWARDEVINYTLDILEAEMVPATIFVTHESATIERMRKNPLIELGVHPNFIPLEDEDYKVKDFLGWSKDKLKWYKKLVPEATSIRSHGLLQSSRLMDLFLEMGFVRESNLLITMSSGMTLLPFYHWNGLLRVPYFWEDDIHCVELGRGTYKDWKIEPFVYNNSIKIFDFHPIHIFLNSNDLKRYEAARPYFKEGDGLYKYVDRNCIGDEVFLKRLIKFGKEEGFAFRRLDEIKR